MVLGLFGPQDFGFRPSHWVFKHFGVQDFGHAEQHYITAGAACKTMTIVVLFFALLGWKCLEVNEKAVE